MAASSAPSAAAPSAASGQPHRITQSYYDDLLTENAELFDYDVTTPEGQRATVLETLDQLRTTTTTSNTNAPTTARHAEAEEAEEETTALSHLCLSHPSSPHGSQVRWIRGQYETALQNLDQLIGSDGSVQIPTEAEEVDVPEGWLERVGRECAGVGGGAADAGDVAAKLAVETSVGEAEEGRARIDAVGAYPALVTFQSSQSVYTLMSLLGAVRLSSSSATSGDSADRADNGSSEDQIDELRHRERILRATCRALSSILSPPSSATAMKTMVTSTLAAHSDPTTDENNAADGDGNTENSGNDKGSEVKEDGKSTKLKHQMVIAKQIRAIKSEIRDGFVAFERVVGLMGHYTSLLVSRNGTVHQPTEEGAQNGKREQREAEVVDVLTELAQLASSACGGCEKNKVAFVKARWSANTGSSGGSNQKSPTSAASNLEAGRDGNGGIRALVAALSASLEEAAKPNRSGAIQLQTAYCRLLAVLCRFDDFRQPSATNAGTGPTPDMTVSSAHDHVLEFHRRGIVPILHGVTEGSLRGLEMKSTRTASSCDDDDDDAVAVRVEDEDGASMLELAAAALSATRTLAVNDEIVQALVAVGVLKSARAALAAGVEAGPASEVQTNEGDEVAAAPTVSPTTTKSARHLRSLTSSSLGLLRNLCGNDEIKTNLCLGTADGNAETSSVLPLIISAMQQYRSDGTVQEHGCATLAAMALRKPANARRIVEEGGPREILTAMRRHPNAVTLQRQGALAVRNVSSRLIKLAEAEQPGEGGASGESSPSCANDLTAPVVEVREIFLDLGAESVLRDIAGRHQGSVDEAYAALRDLGCKVSMVRYDTENGQISRGTRGVAIFGATKPKFNPSFEESAGLGAAVNQL